MKTSSLVLSILLPTLLHAQTGSIGGRVTESGSGEPIAGAMILVKMSGDTSLVKGGYADANGYYTVGDLELREYTLTCRAVGYQSVTETGVTPSPGAPVVELDIALMLTPLNLDEVIVSASRKPEKVIDAPASLAVIGPRQIAQRITLAPSDHLRGVAGVDIAQTGVIQQTIVSRGFNNVFSGSLTMLTDNRIAAVPSLRVNIPSFIPLVNDDIDHIEVVRGPGSALYGPNASNGVLNIITRSPFASRGTSMSITGGERSLFQGTFRHAGVFSEKVGFKISGQYFRGRDWEYVDAVEAERRQEAIAAGAHADTLKIGKREPIVERFGGEARMDFNLTDELSANLTAGLNQAVSTIELTDLGAAQAKDWRYTYFQGRITYGDLFAQAFLNQCDAGKTYLLRTGNFVVDRSKQFVAQIQHALSFGGVERVTYGADLLHTTPVTDGTITGRNENDDNITEFGGYVQSETHLNSILDLVLAGRIDKHSRIDDPIFSPRAAIVYKPWNNQTFRATFNRSYSTPTTNELSLDLLSDPNPFGFPEPYAIGARASGVPASGFNFDRDNNGRPFFHSTFSPDRSMPIPVDNIAMLWPAVVQLLVAGGGPDLSQIPAPGPTDVGAIMATLNAETESFDPVDGPHDSPQLRPTITQTLEVGYKGILSEKVKASVDLYYTRINNFVGQFQVFTPNVFMNRDDLLRYLEPYVGTPTATALADEIGRIPLGTVSPREAVDPTALLAAPKNYGKVSLAGMDLSLEYRISELFSCMGTYSFVSDFLTKEEGVGTLALNAPRNKGSLSFSYHGRSGMDAELRGRWREAFLMNSGVYVGTISSYVLLDASVRYPIPGFNDVAFSLSALNLFDKKHRDFIGAPEIGRMIMGKVSYSF